MISLSVVKIKVKDDKYMLTRHELDQVRKLMHSIKAADPKETKKNLDAVLGVKQHFENKKEYSLVLDTIKFGEVFYVWSTRQPLNQQETEHITKTVLCALSAPNTLLTFPDYIMISSTPPPARTKVKPRAKRKKKDADK
jgi:hypothetical protein